MNSQFVKRWRDVCLVQPIYIWLLLLVIAPNAALVIASFMKSSGGAIIMEPTLSNYSRLIERSSYLILIQRTTLMALSAAFLATIIAYPMAYFVSRYVRKHRFAVVLLVIIPLWISLLMRVFAWKIILGENGVFNTFLLEFGILDEPTQIFIYTRHTVVLALAYVAIPYVFVTSYTALERIPSNLIEASRDCGASGFQTFIRVVWPLSKQGVAIGFALAFLLGVGDYVTPSMVGGLDGTMIGVVIASQFGLAGNWPLGSAISIVLVGCVVIILGLVAFSTRSKGIIEEGDAGHVRAVSWSHLKQGGKIVRVIAWFAFLLPYIFLYGPLIIICVFSFNQGTIQAFPLTGFTLQWYSEVLENTNLINALGRSLMVGGLAVLVGGTIGTSFALIFVMVRPRGAVILQSMVSLPVAFPGIILGISLALTFEEIKLYNSLVRVVIGHATFVMPIIMLIVLSRLKSLDPSLNDASSDLGATPVQTLRRITLPLVKTAVIGGALLGFTLSFDEVLISLFLTGAEPTLPIFIWNQLRFGFTPEINAIFTLIGTGSLIAIAIGTRIINKDTSSR